VDYSPALHSADIPKLPLGTLLRALVFLLAGLIHFVLPQAYLRIMPPYLPFPLALIYISGAAEVLGGIGLLVRSLRRTTAWGLVALLIAVWPANIYMATAHLQFPGLIGQSWAQWLRVLLQIPLIYWVWLDTRTVPGSVSVPQTVQVEHDARSQQTVDSK
jgi:uncharacterized membrane protein